MTAKEFAREAFRKEPKLRYVGIVDDGYHIIFSEMREGVSSLTPDEQDRNFVQLMPPIIVDAVEKLQPLLGKLDTVTVRYEKSLLGFFRMQGLILIFSFDPDVTTPFISALSDKMNTLGTTYLVQP